MTPEQEQTIAELRSRNVAPKQIARQLGLRPAEVTAVIKTLAEQVTSQRLATGELAPLYQCLVNNSCLPSLLPDRSPTLGTLDHPGDDPGFALVIVARQPGFNQIEFCSYLVDIFCLGVKDASGLRKVNLSEYKTFTGYAYEPFTTGTTEIDLQLAQAIVFGGLEYAARLGFEPHQDFAAARSHLGEWSGEPKLTFGKDGKPFYVNGPYDNSAKILKTLRESVGEGNFEFLLGKGD
jgi:hypothetical protein